MKTRCFWIITLILTLNSVCGAAEETNRLTASRDMIASLDSFTVALEIRLMAGTEDLNGELTIEGRASTILAPFQRESAYSLRTGLAEEIGREYILEGFRYTGQTLTDMEGEETEAWSKAPYQSGARYMDNLYDLNHILALLPPDLEEAGAEEMGGRDTDKFSGQLSKGNSVQLIEDLFADMGAELPNDLDIPVLAVDVWLNADNYPVRVRIDLLPAFAPWYEDNRNAEAALLEAFLTLDLIGANDVESIQLPDSVEIPES